MESKTIIKKNIKIFLSDIDGTLTDGGMYYSADGESFKKFHTHDGKGFELLRNNNIKTGLITTEINEINVKRFDKLKLDFLVQGVESNGKLKTAIEICSKEGVSINEVAYIGDDVNCLELLQSVGLAACPNNSQAIIKNIPGIILLDKNGGDGAVREFANYILDL